jgi:hypothetical protein
MIAILMGRNGQIIVIENAFELRTMPAHETDMVGTALISVSIMT